MVYSQMAVPERASVALLEVKLAELGGDDIADEWFCRAVSVLRGGDGGEHGQLLYKLVFGMLREIWPVVALDVSTATGFQARNGAGDLIGQRVGISVLGGYGGSPRKCRVARA